MFWKSDSAEKRALHWLDYYQQKREDGVDWDEDTEVVLVGSGDQMAQQRRELSQGIWKHIVNGDYDQFKAELDKDPSLGTMRGVFGETTLHIALLFGKGQSENHTKIARHLIEQFPDLVNQTYEHEPYTGEAPIHMALINRDDDMVKYLVEHQAKLDVKAYGAFFRPSGKVYYGEYPLSFAACLGNKNMVEYLIENGADVTLRDGVLGNTVLHLLVIYEEPDMYEFVIEQIKKRAKLAEGIEKVVETFYTPKERKKIGIKWRKKDNKRHEIPENNGELEIDLSNKKGKLRLDQIPNFFGRTPLTLAADLGKIRMFKRLVSARKEELWSYGRVRAVAYPLVEIDPKTPCSPGIRSAIELVISFSEDDKFFSNLKYERAKLLDITPIDQLLQSKWSKFAKKWFYLWCITYFFYLLIMTAAILLPPAEYRTSVLESIVLAGACVMIILELIDINQLGWYYLKEKGSRIFYFLSWCQSISVILTAIFRFTLTETYSFKPELATTCTAIVCAWCYLLFFARGFKQIGHLVVMIREVLFIDISRFILIYFVFLLGFSVAFTVVFEDSGSEYFKGIGFTMLSLYQIFLAEFQPLEDFGIARSSGLASALLIAYTIAVTILMLNLIIAMMNNTFASVQSKAHVQWKVEWASIILLIERRLYRNGRPTGKKGTELGFDNDENYYLILEERISPKEKESIIRPGQNKRSPKLALYVKALQMMKDRASGDPTNDLKRGSGTTEMAVLEGTSDN